MRARAGWSRGAIHELVGRLRRLHDSLGIEASQTRACQSSGRLVHKRRLAPERSQARVGAKPAFSNISTNSGADLPRETSQTLRGAGLPSTSERVAWTRRS